MKTDFVKYHGTGNDFILTDNRLAGWKPTTGQVKQLCDRRFGIGADGFMLLGTADGYDFSMRYFNSDGLESTMCGNGGRCIMAFAASLGIVRDTARFLAVDGEHVAEILTSATGIRYRLHMRDCEIGRKEADGTFIDTGSPHFVIFTDHAETTDVVREGRRIRLQERFTPGGTNVDFAEERDGLLFVRTYERGVEDETLSCGTGVTAAALVDAYIKGIPEGTTLIQTPGGSLQVSFRQQNGRFTDIRLEGPAEFVYSGTVDI